LLTEESERLSEVCFFTMLTGQTQLLLSSLAVKNVDTEFILIVKTSNFKFNKLTDRKSEFVELSLIL
jgi:hypothetical protein